MNETLTILDAGEVARLEKGIKANADFYSTGSAAIVNNPPRMRTTILPKTDIPVLDGSRNALPEKELSNSIALYTFLGNLTRTQASDPRLWVTLAHLHFPDYVRARWPVGSSDQGDKFTNSVLSHWFVQGGLQALRRHGISRLWWAAELTSAAALKIQEVKPAVEAAPYRYTRVLFSNQDVYQGVMERRFGLSTVVRIAILHCLEGKETTSASANNFFKAINETALYNALPAMSFGYLTELFNSLLKYTVEDPKLSPTVGAKTEPE